jgi:hypothetical protein
LAEGDTTIYISLTNISKWAYNIFIVVDK